MADKKPKDTVDDSTEQKKAKQAKPKAAVKKESSPKKDVKAKAGKAVVSEKVTKASAEKAKSSDSSGSSDSKGKKVKEKKIKATVDKDVKSKDTKAKKSKVQEKTKGDASKGSDAKAAKQSDTSKKARKPAPVPRLQTLYRDQITADLMKKFNFGNRMLVPAITKIVLNVGNGTLHADPKLAESIALELGVICGQKPVMTKARKSISNFKLRQGMVVGCKVTLRRAQMYEFLDRLISIAIPRIRDFRGLSDRSFDGRGSYTFGIKEQIVFPEIDYDKVVQIHGMDITICTSAPNDEQALALIQAFGFPFRRRTVDEAVAAA